MLLSHKATFKTTLYLFLIITNLLFSQIPIPQQTPGPNGDSLHLVKILTRTNAGVLYAKGIGDLNNDGYADFIATDYQTTDIYLGNAAFAVTPSYRLTGGYFLETGDVNNDGYDDLLQVETDTTIDHPYQVRLSVFYGGQNLGSRIEPLYTLEWLTPGMYLEKLQKIGDINGDGYDDIVFSNCYNVMRDGRGYVYIFYGGQQLSHSPDVTLRSRRNYVFDGFGYAISGIGDINKDGYADFMVTAPVFYPKVDTSRAYLYYGGMPFDTIPDKIYYPEGERQTDLLSEIGYAGDINKDGNPDFLLGESMDRSTLLYTDINTFYPYFGFNFTNGLYIGTGGDVNNDGYADFILSNDTQQLSDTTVGGMVRVYLGNHDVYSIGYITLTSSANLCRFGNYSGIIGDYNGDGYDDVVIGEPAYPASGRAFVYSYGNITGVEPGSQGKSFALLQNYPNPFNPATTIRYGVEKGGYVTIEVYNTIGQKVCCLFAGEQAAGVHSVYFDGAQLPAGPYFCRLSAGNTISTVKMVLLK